MAGNILDKIVAYKRGFLDRCMAQTPFEEMAQIGRRRARAAFVF